jgi:hypothetical protein
VTRTLFVSCRVHSRSALIARCVIAWPRSCLRGRWAGSARRQLSKGLVAGHVGCQRCSQMTGKGVRGGSDLIGVALWLLPGNGMTCVCHLGRRPEHRVTTNHQGSLRLPTLPSARRLTNDLGPCRSKCGAPRHAGTRRMAMAAKSIVSRSADRALDGNDVSRIAIMGYCCWTSSL